ncbi:MAG: DNA-binding response regulator [Oxalobacteraceae bacterium]|nr:DNA-binding response regulator [Oxalobacteraceae bacterium]
MPTSASKLLLVEDEIRIAEFVIPDLQAAGFQVTHVKDGANGLTAILSGEHDLVILDVMLPILNGFEVLASGKPVIAFGSAPSEVFIGSQPFSFSAGMEGTRATRVAPHFTMVHSFCYLIVTAFILRG